MELIADILLVAGALGAGFYCFVLSRRLKRFTDLEKGVGGAVSVLSSQADELKKSMDTARAASDRSGSALQELTLRAESVAQRLELMMASMHDVIPEDGEVQKPDTDSTEQDMPPNQTVSEESQDSEEEVPEEPDPLPVATVKQPEGLMFFRHDRKQGEVAT